MAFTPVPLIAGVVVSAVYADFAVSAPWPPSGTAATLGVDYSINGTTGRITVLRSFGFFGGWMRFSFADAGGTIAAAPEFPAVDARLTVDVSGTAAGVGLGNFDMASRLSTTASVQIMSAPQVQSGIIYDGTDFDIAAGSDGAFASVDPQGMTLLFELDITAVASDFWTDLTGCTEDTDIDKLSKDYERVIDPGQAGQPFMAPLHLCVPRPPAGPPGGGQPPGGGGSNPPPGDTTIVCSIVPLTLPGDTSPRCVRVCVITTPDGSTVTTEPVSCPPS